MKKCLFLAWQDQARSRAWYPIGRLDADREAHDFQFAYTKGALKAHDEACLDPLVSFPDFYQVYHSTQLFPLFSNRVLSSKRADFHEYLERLALGAQEADPISILAVSGGERQTDNLEVFPRVDRQADGSFQCRFFLHGWRHVNQHAQERLAQFGSGDSLRVALELNNPATGLAVQLQTEDDYCMLGWAPRYLIHDLVQVIAEAPTDIQASIVRINPVPAPSKQRILIELQGVWPQSYEPMSRGDFELIHSAA